MNNLEDLSQYVQSFLKEDSNEHYSVFLVSKEDDTVDMTVVRMPSNDKERMYKIEQSFDADSKTTDDLILLAKMCVKTIENYLENDGE